MLLNIFKKIEQLHTHKPILQDLLHTNSIIINIEYIIVSHIIITTTIMVYNLNNTGIIIRPCFRMLIVCGINP